MTKLVYDNQSIECLSADVITRKVERSALVLIKNVGRCASWKCSRNSEAKIIKELNPKEAKYNKNSALNLNDRVEAENIILYINCMKNITSKLRNHSSSHKAQNYVTTEYTVAKITKQIPNIPQLVPPAQVVAIDE